MWLNNWYKRNLCEKLHNPEWVGPLYQIILTLQPITNLKLDAQEQTNIPPEITFRVIIFPKNIFTIPRKRFVYPIYVYYWSKSKFPLKHFNKGPTLIYPGSPIWLWWKWFWDYLWSDHGRDNINTKLVCLADFSALPCVNNAVYFVSPLKNKCFV
jgi:hypothetical protein